MPKLKLPYKTLFEKFSGRGYDQCPEFTPYAEPGNSSLETPQQQQQQATDCNYNTNLQRAVVLQRTPSFSPWIGGDYFLCVSVKEAVDLAPAVPVRTATCDSFVRVSLQNKSFVSAPEEAETRIIYRNCNPMWQEILPFPLDNVTEDTVLFLRVLDKDIGHFNSFVGMVSLPITEVLSQVWELGCEKPYRLPLVDRQNVTKKRGELMFGVSVVAKHEYKKMRGFISSLQDPDKVHDTLRDYCLNVKLHCLKELSGLNASLASPLEMEVTVCSFVIRKPLTGTLVGGELDPEGAEVEVPLGSAFQDGDVLKGKHRAQFGEVKVEIWAGRTRLAKTQVPIWSVPVRSESTAVNDAADSDSEAEQERDPSERSSRSRPSSKITGQTDLPTQAGKSKSPSSAGPVATPPCPHFQSPDVSQKDDPDLVAAAAARRRSENCVAAMARNGVAEAVDANAGGGAKWDGMRYSRRMERMDRSLNKSPLVILSMQLVRADPSEPFDDGTLAMTSMDSLTGDGNEEFNEADSDSPAEPLVVPEFMGVSVADFVVEVGPMALLKAIYADDSELAQKMFSLEKVTDLKVSPWGPDPDRKALCMRNLSYVKPSPLVGSVEVQSHQKVLLRHAGGFVLHQYVTPNVPTAGRCVQIIAQVAGQHIGPGKTRFTVAVKLEWLKSGIMVNVVKGKIEAATPKDTRMFFESLKAELATKYTVTDSAAAVRGLPSGDISFTASTTAAAADSGGFTGAEHSAHRGDGVGGWLALLSNPSVALYVVLCSILLVMVLLMVGAVRQVRDELDRSRKALEGVSQAVEALRIQLAAASATATSCSN